MARALYCDGLHHVSPSLLAAQCITSANGWKIQRVDTHNVADDARLLPTAEGRDDSIASPA